jgi:hypothetical protein
VKVRECGRGHQVPVQCVQCPWCAIDNERAARKAQRAAATQKQTIFKVAPAPTVAASTPTRSAITPPRPPAAYPPAATSTGNGAKIGIFAAAIATAAIIFVILIGVAVGAHQSSTSGHPTYASTTSIDMPNTLSSTTIYTPTYTQTYTPTYTSMVPSTYPPPNAQSFDSVFQNAKVGECVNRELGAPRRDGSSELTSFYLTDCGAADATDKVTKRTSDTNECPENWARSDTPPRIVLCLRKN